MPHEMGFARNVANRVTFMDAGKIVEDLRHGAVLREYQGGQGVPVEDPASLTAGR